ncbi:MAG TPA: TraM recognition domain-containing protein [Acidimicrobiales bacterium]|nr:TraM recognition domain-containing protein [Acidimicrobiales bacterium]
MLDPLPVIMGTAALGVVPSATVVSLRARSGQDWSSGLVTHSLGLPADLDLGQVEALLSGLGGLRPPGWRRALSVSAVVCEVVATEAGIQHRLAVMPGQQDIVTAHLRAAVPGASLVAGADRLPWPTRAVELETSSRHFQLRIEQPEAISRAVLAALAPLPPDITVMVQVIISPTTAQAPARPGPWLVPALTGKDVPLTPDQTKALRAKYAGPLFGVCLRLGVVAPTEALSKQFLGPLVAAFAGSASPLVHLRPRSLRSRRVARAMAHRQLPTLSWPALFNARELAALVAWPPAGTSLPGLRLGTTRALAPDPTIARSGRVLADSSYPGIERPLAISATDARRHTYVIGPTGVGKSTLLLGNIVQDMEAGHGVVVIDPKGGDLITDVLERVPAHRTDDVIVLDPTDDDVPVGFNLLAAGTNGPELAAEQLVGVFHRLYATSWGPRTSDIFTSAALSLAAVPGSTLADLPVILTDDGFRERIVAQLDPVIAFGVRPFWAWYTALKEGERNQIIAPALNKARSVLVRPRLRRTLGQAAPLLDFDDLLARRKILLVPLSVGLLGEDSASLLGALLLSNLWLAVQRRAGLPPAERQFVACYLDEFQAVLRLPVPLPDVLAQARSLGFGLTLAHQHLGQLTGDLREAVLANCATQVYFRPAAADAARLSREVPPLDATDLQHLGAYEVVARLAADGRTAPPVTGRTRPAPPKTSDPEAIRERSRQRYGRPAAEVDAELRRRHEGAPVGPVGRQRRSA